MKEKTSDPGFVPDRPRKSLFFLSLSCALAKIEIGFDRRARIDFRDHEQIMRRPTVIPPGRAIGIRIRYIRFKLKCRTKRAAYGCTLVCVLGGGRARCEMRAESKEPIEGRIVRIGLHSVSRQNGDSAIVPVSSNVEMSRDRLRCINRVG